MTEDEIDRRIAEADKAWNVAALSIAFKNMLELDPSLTLATLERALRRIGSKTTYLLAVPAEDYPIPDNLPLGSIIRFVRLPDEQPAKFGLWICLRGPDDIMHALASLEITGEQNLANLELCGWTVLIPPGLPGSPDNIGC